MRYWLAVLFLTVAFHEIDRTAILLADDSVDAKLGTLDPDGSLLWFDIRHLTLEGQGWNDVQEPFDRLPRKAEKIVRKPVWDLSRHSAGLAARFVTDAPAIHARWTVTNNRLEMPHMPATGVSGLDLYVQWKDAPWRWLANGRPTQSPTNTAQLAGGLPAGQREYCLYLPLYNGVKSVEIGIPKTASLSRGPQRPDALRKPLVFWGTSITQGGCASRPGMVHTAILGRRLSRAVVNLGFSGNGKMEPEMAELIGEIDAAAYIIDCLPNCTADEVTERTEPLVRALRRARPRTPILLAEDRSYSDSYLVTAKRDRSLASRAALKAAFDRLQSEGVPELHYLTGDPQLGDDAEGTVDSSHPTDLGFMRMADVFEVALRKILREEPSSR